MSTTKPSMKPPTLADLDALPPGIVGEIIEGVLYTMTKPRARHQRTGLEIGSGLLGPFDHGRNGPGGWWIIAAPGIELPNNTKELSPDVAGWRREKMPVLPNVAAFTQAPDWACEVVSPATAGADRVRKMRIYARESVGHLWLVDPLAKTLEAYRLQDAHWVVASTHTGSERVRAEPFAAVELEIARWWLEP